MSLHTLDLDESDRDQFRPVLDKVKLDRLPSFAASVRCLGHQSTRYVSADTAPQQIECDVLPKVVCGSYNAVITLSFSDGQQWILKVPRRGHGECWNTPLAQALESEAQTMRLLQYETTIPIPKIFAFDSSLENELGCPFILMEKVPGRPLSQGWYDDKSSRAKVNQFRVRALQGIAEAMVQLNKFTFDQSGAPVFKGGVFSDIGARHVADFNALFYQNGNFTDDDGLPFSEVGPFDDVRSYFLSALDQRENQSEHTVRDRGSRALLRQFVEWIQADEILSQDKPFVLGHPDLSTQNILTLEDGTLSGIIDWDWVAAVPHSVGCQKYPEFLMADYDPDGYEFDVKKGEALNDSGECSPGELVCYRATYAQAMERAADRRTADVTRRSAVINSLEVAADLPMTTLRMIGHVFDEIKDLTDEGKEECSDTESESSNGSEEEDPVNSMIFDKLVEDIEKIAASTHKDSCCKTRFTEFGTALAANDDNPQLIPDAMKTTSCSRRLSRGRGLGQVACNWGAKKCRNIVRRLHRPNHEGNSSQGQEESIPLEEDKPRYHKARFVRAVCRMTQSVLKRVIKTLHSEENLVTASTNPHGGENNLEAIIRWLRKKLDQILQLLYLKVPKHAHTNDEHGNSQGNHTHSEMQKEKLKGDHAKMDACILITGMLQENKGEMLSYYAQQAFTRWIVNSIRPEEPPAQITGKESPDRISTEKYHAEAMKQASRVAVSKETQAPQKDIVDAFENEGSKYSDRDPEILSDADLHSFMDPSSTHCKEVQDYTSLGAEDGDLSAKPSFDLVFPNHNRTEEFAKVTRDVYVGDEMLPDYGRNQTETMAETVPYKPNDIGATLLPDPGTENCVASAGIQGGESDEESTECGKSEADSSNADDEDEDVTDIIAQSDLDSEVGAIYDDYMNDGKSDGEDIDEKQGVLVIDSSKEEEEDIDHGTFTMFDVCIALSHGALDKQRMDRLKTGFFALLNQTL